MLVRLKWGYLPARSQSSKAPGPKPVSSKDRKVGQDVYPERGELRERGHADTVTSREFVAKLDAPNILPFLYIYCFGSQSIK